MNNLKVGIVEDDLIIADAIAEMLTDNGYLVTDPATRYSEAIEMIESEKPDLLLLDINILGKLDGIEIARTVRKNWDIPFIFLTANTDSATVNRAKEVLPSAFLAKPVTSAQLYAAIEIAVANYVAPANEPGNEHRSAPRFLFVKEGYSYCKVMHDDIAFAESEQNYVAIRLKDKRKFLLRSTFNDFEETLDPEKFVRTHRCCVASIASIERIEGNEMVINGFRMPISKTHRQGVVDRLGIRK